MILTNLYGFVQRELALGEKYQNSDITTLMQKVDDSGFGPKVVNAKRDGTIAATVFNMGAVTKQTLLVTEQMPATANQTSPANIRVRGDGDGQIIVSTGITFTIAGYFEAPYVPIFAGAGTVLLTGTSQVVPQWWGAKGDGINDDGPAIRAAIASVKAAGGGEIYFPPGIYLMSTPVYYGAFWGWATLLLSSDGIRLRGVRGKSILRIPSSVLAVGILATKDTSLSTMPAITHAINPVLTAGAGSIVTTTAAHAGSYVAGDFIMIRTGDTAGGILNPDAEITQVESVNAGTGVIKLRIPTAKPYLQERYALGNTNYPALAPLGIVKVTDRVIQNISLDGLRVEHLGSGVTTSGRFVVGSVTKNCDFFAQPPAGVSPHGYQGFGSRFHTLRNSTVECVTGSSTLAGVFLAPDTTCTDLDAYGNTFISRGHSYFHVTEGAANVNIHDNEIAIVAEGIGVSDATAAVLPITARAHNVRFNKNKVGMDCGGNMKLLDVYYTSRGFQCTDNMLDVTNPGAIFARCYQFYSDVLVRDNIACRASLIWAFGDPNLTTTVDNILNPPDNKVTADKPKRGVWRQRDRLARTAPNAGVPAGYVNVRAGRSAPTWAASTEYYSKWRPSLAYLVGALVIPDDELGNGLAYRCTTAGTSAATQPVWPASGTIADGSAVWTVYNFIGNTAQVLTLYVVPTVDNTHVYEVVKGGPSVTVEPTWPTGAGAEVTQDSVTYREVGTAALWRAEANLV